MATKGAHIGFRCSTRFLEALDEFSSFLGITRTKLVEQSVSNSVRIHTVAARAHNETVAELVRRYGPDSPLTVSLDDDGEAVLLVDGEVPDDVDVHSVVDERRRRAFVFLEIQGLRREFGSFALGDGMFLTLPSRAFAVLPWPPGDLGLVCRLWELQEKADAGALVELPAEAVA
jgi:hypothetical protein